MTAVDAHGDLVVACRMDGIDIRIRVALQLLEPEPWGARVRRQILEFVVD